MHQDLIQYLQEPRSIDQMTEYFGVCPDTIYKRIRQIRKEASIFVHHGTKPRLYQAGKYPLRITINSAVNKPTDLTTYTFEDFPTLAAAIEESTSAGKKTDSDLLVPVAEWNELHRRISAIKRMARIFCCDLDMLTEENVDTVFEALENTSACIYTTHGHLQPRKKSLGCYRVVIELDREYDLQEHDTLWRAINNKLGGLLDKGARTPEQAYYLPTHPEGTTPEFALLEGRPWCVDTLLRDAPPIVPEKATKEPLGLVDKEDVEIALKHWSGAADPVRKEVAKAAKQILKDKNPIPLHEGKRNDFLTRLSGFLASSFLNKDPRGLAKCFEGIGWDLFAQDGKYTLDMLAEMIERMQVKERSRREEKIKAKIEAATGGERSHPITDEEIAGLEKTIGPGWSSQIVAICNRDMFFLRPDGTYDPGAVVRDNLFVAARDRLAVFGDHVRYTFEDAKGIPRRYTDKAFLEIYGKVVRAVVFDLSRPRGGYDPQTETIFFPAATRIVEPVPHLDVHEWLEYGGDHLLDILSQMSHFDQMLPALVLTGDPGCGKTILAKGLGQMYGSDPLDAEEAFDKFNAEIQTKQPIIFIDEKAPNVYRREGTTFIRRFLTCSSRRLDEKYRTRIELRGFLRLVIAANNLDVLNTQEDMSAEDRMAFGERLIHIDLTAGKAALPPARYIAQHWLNGRHLAEHLAWLGENWQVRNPGDRFAVASNRTSLHDGLASRNGIADDVAYWLLSFVASPQRALSAHLPLSLDDGKLRVNAKALVKGWAHYLDGHMPPKPGQISRALKSLARKRTQIKIDGKRIDVHEIDPALLRSANDVHRLVPDFEKILLDNT